MRSLSFTAVIVLHAVASGLQYGFDIIDHTGLASGTVYPSLSRLERDGFLRSSWEHAATAHDEKRPPRRYYAITAQGVRALDGALGRLRGLIPLPASRRSPAKGRP